MELENALSLFFDFCFFFLAAFVIALVAETIRVFLVKVLGLKSFGRKS